MSNVTHLSENVQRLIDEHLDAIDAALRSANVSRSERQSIVDNVEVQISDMISERFPGAPSEGDVVALLAQLDPPESFVGVAGKPAPVSGSRQPQDLDARRPRMSRVAVAGALWAIAFFSCVPLYFVAREAVPANDLEIGGGLSLWSRFSAAWFVFARFLLFAGVTAPIGTTLLGLVSISQIRHSGGRLVGLPLAIADTLVFPIVSCNSSLYRGSQWLVYGIRVWKVAVAARLGNSLV